MARIVDAPQRNVREQRFKYAGKTYFCREPKPEEINECDLVRSKAFFDAIKKGVPTESEFIAELERQRRFSDTVYEAETLEIGRQINENVQKIATSQNEEDLKEALQACEKLRGDLHTKVRKRNEFLQHSAESKANNEYNMALMSACIYDNVRKPVFADIDDVTGCINIEQGYSAVKNCDDWGLISACINVFMPFSAGILNPTDIQPEYAAYAERRKQLRLPDDDIVSQVKDYKKRMADEDGDTSDVPPANLVDAATEDEDAPPPPPQRKKEAVIQAEAQKPKLEEAQTSLFDDSEEEKPKPQPQVLPKKQSEEIDLSAMMPKDSDTEVVIPPPPQPKKRKRVADEVEDQTELEDSGKLKIFSAAGDTIIGDGSGSPGVPTRSSKEDDE